MKGGIGLNKKDVLKAFKLELSALLSSISTYVYIALMLFASVFFIGYLNFYNSISMLEFSMRYLSLPLMVFMPLLTSSIFRSSFERDRMLVSFGMDPRSLVLARIAAVCLVALFPSALLITVPLFLCTVGNVSFLGAYLGIFGFMLFTVALASLMSLIASFFRTKKSSIIISYGAVLTLYLGNLLFATLTAAPFKLMLAAALIFAIIGACVFAITGSSTNAFTVLAIGTLIFAVLSISISSFAFTLIKPMLGFFMINSSLEGFLYGAFSIRSALMLIIFTALTVMLTLLCTQKRRYTCTEEV